MAQSWFPSQIAEAFENDDSGTASIGSGYTYSGHPVGAAAAIACLEETRRLNVAANAAARGSELWDGIRELKERHPLVGDVRGGHGLMLALELVSDRDAKTPIDKATIGRVQEIAYQEGVMIRVSGANVILSPSLVLSAEDGQAILSALDRGLSEA